MARPYDPGEQRAAEIFRYFPEEVQTDETFQYLYMNLFDRSNNWNEAHDWHDAIQKYLSSEYDLLFDYYFDWEDWRLDRDS